MNWSSPIFIILLATGVVLMLAGWLLGKFPEPEINFISGYRTRNSMKSQERWDFAQRYCMQQFIVSGALAAILSPLGTLIHLDMPADYFIGLGCLIPLAILPIARTEIALRNRFNKKKTTAQ